jgi:uncharacterized damage-inducible protein DinB
MTDPLTNAASPHRTEGRAGDAVVVPLRAVLAQLAEVVDSLEDEQYTRKGLAHLGASVGGHVRHCLDHVSALLAGIETGVVDYEKRERGGDIETCRSAALGLMKDLDARLVDIGDTSPAAPMSTIVMLAADDAPLKSTSTFGRECGFVLSHTIHHSAMIGAMVRDMGGEVPEHFGYAPGTVAFLKRA